MKISSILCLKTIPLMEKNLIFAEKMAQMLTCIEERPQRRPPPTLDSLYFSVFGLSAKNIRYQNYLQILREIHFFAHMNHLKQICAKNTSDKLFANITADLIVTLDEGHIVKESFCKQIHDKELNIPRKAPISALYPHAAFECSEKPG